MRVNQLRLEAAFRPDSMDKIGTEKTDQSEFGRPGRCNVAGHTPRIGELFVAAGRVPESLDADALNLLGSGESGTCRRHDANIHVLTPERDRETEDKRAGGVSFRSWE
ncbi:MAG: hypothetical protein NVSMB53_06110 [Gemmatimonadaceae bacterium]